MKYKGSCAYQKMIEVNRIFFSKRKKIKTYKNGNFRMLNNIYIVHNRTTLMYSKTLQINIYNSIKLN